MTQGARKLLTCRLAPSLTEAGDTDRLARDEEFDLDRACLALWGKSPEDGRPAHLLLQHLYDTAAVAEIVWERHLSERLRARLDLLSGGRGREVLAFIAGIHDVGKATPIFQAQCPEQVPVVRGAGLRWGEVSRRASAWHHSLAGGATVRALARMAGWPREAADWIWPLVAGHHGRIPPVAAVTPPSLTSDHGDDRWAAVRARLVECVAEAVGLEAGSLAGLKRPSRGEQLALVGVVVMADWVASNEAAFPPVSSPGAVGMSLARARAAEGWDALRLGGGWHARSLPRGDLILARFGRPARPLQTTATAVASEMTAPGLVIVEAPMGEGKTEAALAAAEILARRLGARGLFVGMPTQATSDPMFDRVAAWSREAAPGVPMALLHGKRMFNATWRALLRTVRVHGVDEQVGNGAGGGPSVADWFLGRKRGLLTPLAIGTIDNLLLAGARTSHVMVRHAGLAGKVVILDEVHAASVYMAQYLFEALRWLGSAGTPVIVLTATLPPDLRKRLAAAYLEGAFEAARHEEPASAAERAASDLPMPGYPGVMATWVAGARAERAVCNAVAWRPSQRVRVQVDTELDEDGKELAAILAEDLEDGGCVLVIRNTVGTAQRTYLTLRERFGNDVRLLHARLTAGERARRAADELARLGPDAADRRPRRHILVATQVAEQSFDVDADLLVSDIAPIDLLLQRVGRLHRHDRVTRPPRLAEPRVHVTGLRLRHDRAPEFAAGTRAVYRAHRLIRAAALVVAAGPQGWDIPREVPALVAAGYGDAHLGPAEWMPDATRAADEERAWIADLEATAQQGILSPRAAFATATLAGLHRLERPVDDDELAVEGIVREGGQSAEVLLVRADAGGAMLTLSGRPLVEGTRLVADEQAIEEAVASAVRLPPVPEVTAAVRDLAPPAAWSSDPLLRGFRALVLDADSRAWIAGRAFRYDEDLGLVHGDLA